MARKNYHVVPLKDEGKWAVIGENKDKADSLHNTQREAIERGRGTRIKIYYSIDRKRKRISSKQSERTRNTRKRREN